MYTLQVLLVLRELEVFFTDIEPQVEAISGDTIDPDHIMTLVTIFNKVMNWTITLP